MAPRKPSKAKPAWTLRGVADLGGRLPERLLIHVPAREWARASKGIPVRERREPPSGPCLRVLHLPGDGGVLLVPSCEPGPVGGDCCGGEPDDHGEECVPVAVRRGKAVTFRCRHAGAARAGSPLCDITLSWPSGRLRCETTRRCGRCIGYFLVVPGPWGVQAWFRCECRTTHPK